MGRVVAGGHQVELLTQEPSRAQKLATELGPAAAALEAGAPFGGEAKGKVARLATDGGLRPLDVGPLARAQQLEQLGFPSAVKLHP